MADEVEFNSPEEVARRTKMLEVFMVKNQDIVQKWIDTHGPMLRPPIIFDVDTDQWMWVNRKKRKRMAKAKKEPRHEKTLSRILDLNGKPFNGEGSLETKPSPEPSKKIIVPSEKSFTTIHRGEGDLPPKAHPIDQGRSAGKIIEKS